MPRRGRGFPSAALALTLLFSAFALLPSVRANPNLVAAFLGTAAVLVAWTVLLWVLARRSGREFRIELTPPLKSHYIQGSVQLCIYVYWGWYWRNVYSQAPLIVSQLVFLYAFDALLSWSRGRDWRLGFGPLPIILSTNVFLWFKEDWFAFQFALVATAALGKEFIRWTREGKRTHIFNPSAFGLGVFSIVLIVTGTTQYTWGPEVASTLARPPHIYLEIFFLGLIVQYFFSVTLMTLGATAVLVLLNLAYNASTGTYFFVDTNLPIAIFLGLHLLVTDPSTSPRTDLGRLIFGGLYGLANFVLYWLFERWNVPEFYDKLLPVLALNLSVQWIDRVARAGILGRFTRWEASCAPRRRNYVHMGVWIALFAAMLTSGYVEAPHPGASLDYWKQAYRARKFDTGPKLYKIAGSQANQGSGAACNELGVIYMEGKLAPQDRAAAAHYFATACELGDSEGCANVAAQFLYLREARSGKDAEHALGALEQQCAQGGAGRACTLLGFAHETGRGRPLDKGRARELYRRACAAGDLEACKGLARLSLAGASRPEELVEIVRVLQNARAAGDVESHVYLAYLHHAGIGVPQDDAKARALLEKACALGSRQACEALKQAQSSPFAAALAVDRTVPVSWSSSP